VLFNKSATPGSYLGQLQSFYEASHDFRLLTGLPDAVIGHTAKRVYPFVQGMQPVLDEVRDEATVDEIIKRISELRPRAKTAVDRRALDMLELMVERRAAEIKNQPGPHLDKALAALVRAGKGEWSPGEPRLMADFLAALGKITQTALADEQLRQLKALPKETPPGSLDRLHVAHQHAAILNGYGKRDGALDIMQAALAEHQTAKDGVLPMTANDALAAYIGYLEDAGQFARGEKTLAAQLTHPANAEQRRWLVIRLDELYLRALKADGEVSLGKGAMLYRALNAKIQKDLADPDESHRFGLVSHLGAVYRAARDKKINAVDADLKAFAFEIVPPLLKEQKNQHEEMVGLIAQTVYALLGPRDGIAFLLDEIDREPRWLRFANQDGWSQHALTLANWRLEATDLGNVEGRLLNLVLTELHRDLETREQRNGWMYRRSTDSGRFWKAKAGDFAKAAEDVLVKRDESGPSVAYIADYFAYGLEQPKRAIEILFAAHKKNLLDDNIQATLVNLLHREERYSESIPLLVPLVERQPGSLDERVLLMRAYFKTDRKADLLALLKKTDAFFHEKDRWDESPLRSLAFSTLENELFDQSVAYFKELIPLHERRISDYGINPGRLSYYHAGLAKAYAGLKKTPEAVDAAGAAIVVWGNDQSNRKEALATLKEVLVDSADLDGFVSHFDKQDKDSAIVRKEIGQAYRDKKEFAKAIKQLEHAAELQPNDAEVHQLLVELFDAVGDKAGAIRQLLKAVQVSRRDLKLYEGLGKRYAALGQAKEAERAYTSIVEMQPTEAESHALLAGIREKQDRWADAIHEWQQVVRLRALEPTGLLKLAAAQIHAKQWDDARATLRKVDSRRWPTHFGDVPRQVRELEAELTKQRKK
jgi:tetratricopeptide (TPR) repeat protein